MSDKLSFSQALQEVKRGNFMSRARWNGKGKWIFLMTDQPRGHDDFIAVKASNGRTSPWVPSQNDMLAEDWGIA